MRSALLYLALLFTPALFTPACTSLEEDVCDAKCDCEGCSDRDYNNCVGDHSSDARAADSLGCPDLYDELVVCEQETYICRGTDFDTSCKNEKERLKNCIKD